MWWNSSAHSLQLCDSVRLHNCSLPGSSVHGILQARILEWVALVHSRRSSRPRDGTQVSCVSCISRQILYHCATWETLIILWDKSLYADVRIRTVQADSVTHFLIKKRCIFFLLFSYGSYTHVELSWSNFIKGESLNFPGGAVVKNPPANAGDARNTVSIPGSGWSHGGENGNPLQYSSL